MKRFPEIHIELYFLYIYERFACTEYTKNIRILLYGKHERIRSYQLRTRLFK